MLHWYLMYNNPEPGDFNAQHQYNTNIASSSLKTSDF